MEQAEQDSARDRLKRRALVVAGSISLGLGIVGVVVPLLPTTPFLLLAAACYLRSSPQLYQRLMDSRLAGAYLRRYYSGEGIPARAKATAIGLLWLTIGLSAVFVVDSLVIRILLALIALAVTAHILSIRPKAH